MLKTYSKVLDWCEKVSMLVGGFMMMIMAAVMLQQVILRYAFHSSNVWSEELTRYLFVSVTLLLGFVGIRRNAHLRVEFLIALIPLKPRKVIQIVLDIFVTAMMAIVMVLSIGLVKGSSNNLSLGLGISMSVPYMAIPIGLFLMILAQVEQIAIHVTSLAQHLSCRGRGSEGEGVVQS
ncbi:MAG: TRAP transporter small permease [bacterium]|jgi:TRAP-type C4-dicarboxylate transport system permease small subunit